MRGVSRYSGAASAAVASVQRRQKGAIRPANGRRSATRPFSAPLFLLKVVQSQTAEGEGDVGDEEDAEEQAGLGGGGQDAGQGDLEGADSLQQPEVARRARPEQFEDEQADEERADVGQQAGRQRQVG